MTNAMAMTKMVIGARAERECIESIGRRMVWVQLTCNAPQVP